MRLQMIKNYWAKPVSEIDHQKQKKNSETWFVSEKTDITFGKMGL